MDNDAPEASTAPALADETNTDHQICNDLGDHNYSELVFGCQTKPEFDTFAVQTARDFRMTEGSKVSGKEDPDVCHIKLDALLKLKESTRKLLHLIEDIQSKTHSSSLPSSPIRTALTCDSPRTPQIMEKPSRISDLVNVAALRKLEAEAKSLDIIYIENLDDDCSVYKRLTRKCHCLNRKEFNDFIIHFNEDIKYCTSDLGEIIKNLRILKKFLYMGDGYTKNALIFLNEGLNKCPHNEKVDMVIAISHADLCNVFDNESFVTACIMWPNKYESFGDRMTQNLAARVLYRIAVVEEGRRYLNFNSKITNDVKLVLRKLTSKLDTESLEFLNSTLNLLNPAIVPLINSTYYCKADEGLANKVLNALTHFRFNMTLEEVIVNLNLLNQMSNVDKGKRELRSYLPHVFKLFKHLLIEYDNTKMNETVTSILNNIMSKQPSKVFSTDEPKIFVVNNTATEPIGTKNEINQAPSKRKIPPYPKSRLGYSTVNLGRHNSKRRTK